MSIFELIIIIILTLVVINLIALNLNFTRPYYLIRKYDLKDVNEKSKLRNSYLNMKMDILDILDQKYPFFSSELDIPQRIISNPLKMQEWLSEERFKKIFSLLTRNELRLINSKMKSFLKFLGFHLPLQKNSIYEKAYDDIESYCSQLDECIINNNRTIEWNENADPKTKNGLYLLFCNHQYGRDAFFDFINKHDGRYE